MKKQIFKMLAVLIVLITSINTAWAAQGQQKIDNTQKNTTIQNQKAAEENGTYIYTPNISTQDTLYLKHENKTPSGNWWSRNGGNLINSAVLLLLGALVTYLTSIAGARIERKRKKQEMIEIRAIDAGEKIFHLFSDLRNAKHDATRDKKLNQVTTLVQNSELVMQTDLYIAATNLINFYNQNLGDDMGAIKREKELFEEYKRLYRKNNG